MSDWVEYLTRSGDAPCPGCAASTGAASRGRSPSGASGNESWGCGGNMTAEQYAQLAAQFSTYARNHDGNELYRVAAGPNRDDYHWTETLMKSISTLGGPVEERHHTRWQALSFHYYTHASDDWQHKGSATEFDAEEYHAHDGQRLAHRRDRPRALPGHGRLRPRGHRRPRLRRVGHLVGRRTRHQPRVPVPAEHPARRAGGRPALRRLPRQRAPAGDGEHRPDRQRAAGDGADRRRGDGAHPDVPRVRHERRAPGRHQPPRARRHRRRPPPGRGRRVRDPDDVGQLRARAPRWSR